MKVERAGSERSDAGKADNRARNIQAQTAAAAAPQAAAPDRPSPNAFSKVLQSARSETDDRPRESDRASADGESAVEKTGDGEKPEPSEAKGRGRDDGEGFSGEGDAPGEDPAWAPAAPIAPERGVDANSAAPPARSILHVADLERIVSAVRSETFAGTKTVTIDLKNSVLDGLRIRLTVTEQGNLKAEFLALNEQIKKQLDARRSEIQAVLRSRSIKCGELDIKVAKPEAGNGRIEGLGGQA